MYTAHIKTNSLPKGMVSAGSISFILYFISEVVLKLEYWSAAAGYIAILTVFVSSPIPGNIFGGWLVQKKCGGYLNYEPTLRCASVMGSLSGLSIFMLPVSVMLDSRVLYIFGFWFLLFFGAAPTASINGIAVSLLPEATYAGRYGIQEMFLLCL